MSKGKQRQKAAPTSKKIGLQSGAEIPSGQLAFNGELPHGTKKVSLGPNTKR